MYAGKSNDICQCKLILQILFSHVDVYGFFWQKLNTCVFPYMLAYMQRVAEQEQTKKTSKTETAPSLMISVLTHCSNPPRSQRQHLPSPMETNQINPQRQARMPSLIIVI